MKKYYAIKVLFWLLITTNTFAQVALNPDAIEVVEIPDPNLRQAIRQQLALADDVPITKAIMENLVELGAWRKNIKDLTGLEHATYLNHLAVRYNQIQDLRPIANLIHLRGLLLTKNPISDLTPLSNLINLRSLALDGCQHITDISPLQNLVNLRKLFIQRTPISDFTPIQHLLSNLIEFEYDQVCDIPPQLPSAKDRIESRTFPSIFQPWANIINLDHLTWEQRNVLHDLHWSVGFGTVWDTTITETHLGVATSLAVDLAEAQDIRRRRLAQNPNMIFIRGMSVITGHEHEHPPDTNYWLRDANGEIVRTHDGTPIVNILNPETQDLLVQRVIAYDRCGVLDGVEIDNIGNSGLKWKRYFPRGVTAEDIDQALLNIFRSVRQHVRDDFLIIINTNWSKPIHYGEYLNGIFMETGRNYPSGYSRDSIVELEDTLSWAEDNLREPRINCFEAQGMSTEPPDGPNNLRWMRLFTTMSLTHSDGYVLYTAGINDSHHDHIWYDFWDADLGRPIGAKGQRYQNVAGLFIREFTNGWVVYNRSGKEQAITLPKASTGASSAKQDITHLLPDLDGEIYLRIGKPFDLNRDGTINILDLILVAQHFGTIEGDINGDGITNILDLTLVAQQFSQ